MSSFYHLVLQSLLPCVAYASLIDRPSDGVSFKSHCQNGWSGRNQLANLNDRWCFAHWKPWSDSGLPCVFGNYLENTLVMVIQKTQLQGCNLTYYSTPSLCLLRKCRAFFSILCRINLSHVLRMVHRGLIHSRFQSGLLLTRKNHIDKMVELVATGWHIKSIGIL